MRRRLSSVRAVLACAAVLGVGLGCGGPRVEARAIWLDSQAGDALRRIHVYDRGELGQIEVRGETEVRDHVRLGPRGQGVLVRTADQRGVWLDLDDARRLPLLLPYPTIGADTVAFDGLGDALWWLDATGTSLVPLAPGLAVAREGEGTPVLVPLHDPEPLDWAIASADAPIFFTRQADGGASFLRYPNTPDDAMALVRIAEFAPAGSTLWPYVSHTCSSPITCYTTVAVDPEGELAIAAVDHLGPWLVYDRRTSEVVELELPGPIAEAPRAQLMAVFDRSVSAWISDAQLFRWDRARGVVDGVPLFAKPPLHWVLAEHGRALVLASTSGPLLRLDRARLEVINLETTDCAATSDPVFAPAGRWAAWVCRSDGDDPLGASTIVRVSSAGLERHTGIAMAVAAIDDTGELLLYSVESSAGDEVDGIAPTSRPRNLFVLSSTGVLTRVDELEPAPAPVEIGGLAVYLQALALP